MKDETMTKGILTFKEFVNLVVESIAKKSPTNVTVQFAGYNKESRAVKSGEGICFGSLAYDLSEYSEDVDRWEAEDYTPVFTCADYMFISNLDGYIHQTHLEPWVTFYEEKSDGITYSAAREDFFEWILSKESPWAAVLPSYVNKEGFFWDTDILKKAPADLFMNFCIATRAPRERPECIVLWADLVKSGVDPAYAYFMCGWIRRVGAFGEVFTYSKRDIQSIKAHSLNPKECTLLQTTESDHWAVYPTFTVLAVQNLVRGKPKPKKQPIQEAFDYTPCNRIWGPIASRQISYLTSLISKYHLCEVSSGVATTYLEYKDIVVSEAIELDFYSQNKEK